jgi:hypothetical protein
MVRQTNRMFIVVYRVKSETRENGRERERVIENECNYMQFYWFLMQQTAAVTRRLSLVRGGGEINDREESFEEEHSKRREKSVRMIELKVTILYDRVVN